MGWFDSYDDSCDQKQAYDEVISAPHKATLSHEFIAAAASYEAAKAYEKHCAENGQPDDHATAKEILAGFSGAFIDRMVETKGLVNILTTLQPWTIDYEVERTMHGVYNQAPQ